VTFASAFALGVFFSPPAPAAAPLPSLPSVPRVRIEVAEEHVVALEDVALPRGDWRSGDLDMYVSFGSPGAPVAFDARLHAAPDGGLEAAEGDPGEPVPVDRAPRRPASAHLLLGRAQMAGAVLHVKEAAFRRATDPGGMAILRVRTLLPLPPVDAQAGREIVVRLGIPGGPPLTLGRLQIVALDAKAKIARADAHLCGAESDPYPLAIAITPKPSSAGPPPAKGPVAPVLSVRHASDDLCVRFYEKL
jgi:hypothetical protein